MNECVGRTLIYRPPKPNLQWSNEGRLSHLRALRCPSTYPPLKTVSQTCSAADFVVHALSCNKVSGYTWASRHAHVKKTFKAVLSQYGFHPDAKEPRFNGTCPYVCFMLGMTLALVDVVACNPLGESYVYAEADIPGTTLARAETLKDHEHFDKADKRDMVFLPSGAHDLRAAREEIPHFAAERRTQGASWRMVQRFGARGFRS